MHYLRRGSVVTGTAPYRYAVDGANLLLLYPTPSSSGTLTAYYIPKPTEMSSASHDPSDVTYGNIPVQWHDALELYANWKMASYDDDMSSQIGAAYNAQLQARIREIRGEMLRLGGRKLAPMRLRPGRVRRPTHPSQDIYH